MTKTELELHLENAHLRQQIINLNGMLLGKDLQDVNKEISHYEELLSNLAEEE